MKNKLTALAAIAEHYQLLTEVADAARAPECNYGKSVPQGSHPPSCAYVGEPYQYKHDSTGCPRGRLDAALAALDLFEAEYGGR